MELMGDMADYYESLYDPDRYDWRPRNPPRKPTCRYCGKKALFWLLDDTSGWRLTEQDGSFHECAAYRVARMF
jgi:hypothetical protein